MHARTDPRTRVQAAVSVKKCTRIAPIIALVIMAKLAGKGTRAPADVCAAAMLAADGAANSAVLEKGEERLVAFLLKHYAVELEDIMRRPQERMHYALHIR